MWKRANLLFAFVKLLVLTSLVWSTQTNIVLAQSPNLQATLGSLQNELSGQAPINATFYWVSGATGRHGQTRTIYEISQFAADADSCHVNYLLGNPNGTDTDLSFDLKDVQSIRELSGDDYMQELWTAKGHPEVTATVDPPEYVVVVKVENVVLAREIWLIDEDSAKRVSDDLNTAARMCAEGLASSHSNAYQTSAGQPTEQPSEASGSNSRSTPGGSSGWYESCAWAWKVQGVRGWHWTLSPVYQIPGPPSSIHPSTGCKNFGRWVVKHHPDMLPECNPDSPRFNTMWSDRNGSPMDGYYRTSGEAEAARQRFIEKHRNDEGMVVEELAWTP